MHPSIPCLLADEIRKSSEWDDGHLGVLFLPNPSGSKDVKALAALLPPEREVPALTESGEATHINCQEHFLKPVPAGTERARLRYLVAQEVRQYHQTRDDARIDGFCTAFLASFVEPAVFATYTPSDDGMACGSNPVTDHAWDILFCAIDETRVGLVLHANDE
jgi:hypothetical protein